MSIETRTVLKTYFETGDIPTQDQFYSLIDSYVHKLDDGVTVFQVAGLSQKRFGIGILEPANRLGVKAAGAAESLISLHSDAEPSVHEWSFTLKPGADDNRGFAFEQQTSAGPNNRLFIQGTSGNVGIGTILPTDILHLERSTVGDVTGIKVLNTANAMNQGWKIGQVQDPAEERDGAFAFVESTALSPAERMVVLPGGKVGINEPQPDTLLHVSRSLEVTATDLDLIEGTGIMVLGPMTDNIVADYRGIQARHGEYIGETLELTPAVLNLQRLGGSILIHGDSTFENTEKGIITAEARMGLGTITPVERLDIGGAIKIGTTDNTTDNNGTIRYTGTDFEGRMGDAWISLTNSDGLWAMGTGGAIYYNTGSTPRVAIGVESANATLAVNCEEETSTSISVAAGIRNAATSTSIEPGDNRIGLKIANAGLWGGDPDSKDIALYVSQVEGQVAAHRNLAAILNGNVLVGNMSGEEDVIGNNGSKVLAIQTGVTPSAAAGDLITQLYAKAIDGHAYLHLMNGDGNVISFMKQEPLTAADDASIPDAYDTTTRDVILNMRTRINELEAKLEALGYL